MLPDVTCWVLTDGKAGDEVQCLGVAEALGVDTLVRRVAPRPPFVWLMPYGPIDPREAPDRPGSPIAPPFPDLLIASGRRTVAYVRHVKRASAGRTFTVILKDPRTGMGSADFVWVQEHDRLRGPNVMATLTAPHRISPERLAAARADPPAALAALPRPRVAVLVGGNSRHHRFRRGDVARFAQGLDALVRSGAGLMATASRRTPPALRESVADVVARGAGYLWDGTGENPYLAILALADWVVVTADSTNMIGEAAATGAPVLVFEPGGSGHPKLRAFLNGLQRLGIVHSFSGRLEGNAYLPLNSTPAIANAIAAAFAENRAGHLARQRANGLPRPGGQ